MEEDQFNELFSSYDWKSIQTVLTSYAMILFKIRNRKHINGKEPIDYVQESITLFIEKKRNWNESKYSNIRDFLKSVIDSLIYNDLHSARTKKTIEIEEENLSSLTESMTSDIGNHDDDIIAAELKKKIKEAIKGDENLEIYFEYIEDHFKAEDFSQSLGIPVKDVYNLSRKLRRITEKILKKDD